MRHGVPDPGWKSGPSYDEPTSDEHEFEHGQSKNVDWDGFGVDEVEEVDGEPLVVIHTHSSCMRAGCDATMTQRHLFTTKPLHQDKVELLQSASGRDEIGVYVSEHAELVGPNTIEIPIEPGIDNVDPMISHRLTDTTFKISAEKTLTNPPNGACYGSTRRKPRPERRG